MPQLTKGARELLEQMADLLGAIRQYARECDLADIKMFPLVVEQVLFDIDRTAAAVEDRVRHDLEPMLQRQSTNVASASLPDRVAALEAQVAELRASQGRVIPITRRRRS